MTKIIQITLISLSSFFYIISILLNSLGVYLLCAARPVNSSNILLINLALSEIVVAVISIPTNFVPISSSMLLIGAVLISSLLYYFAMFMLTIDRLVAILFPLKHRVMVTRRRLTLAISTTWFLALLVGICFVILDMHFHIGVGLMHKIFLSLDVTFIVLCVITYGSTLIKMLRRRRLLNIQLDINVENRRRFVTENSRFFKITALIILSFLLFSLIPDVVLNFYFTNNQIFMQCIMTAWSISFVADPCIYIFLQAHLRLLLKSKLSICKRETAPKSTNGHQDTAL